MFTRAISCLTTSNLPWFTELTFQVPMQYCCLQHQTLLLPPDIPTTGHCFCSASLFFLELFLCSSPVAYWTPTDLGISSFNAIPFAFAFSYYFILFMGFSRQEGWNGLPFPPPGGPRSVKLKKAECQRTDAFELWCWRNSWESLG